MLPSASGRQQAATVLVALQICMRMHVAQYMSRAQATSFMTRRLSSDPADLSAGGVYDGLQS